MEGARCYEDREGSPAHAGIDPANPMFNTGRHRFPRTRGDRPIAATYRKERFTVPPHTRG